MSDELRIAITLGDPAGIGPEVALKSLVSSPSSAQRIFLIASASFYRPLAKRLGINLLFRDVENLNDASGRPERGTVYCCGSDHFGGRLKRGYPDKWSTALAVHSIEKAARLAMNGQVDAIVTPPINKASLKKAGFKMPGHTEYLAALSRARRYEMMLVGGPLRVVLVTRHVALKDVSARLTAKMVEDAIGLTHWELERSFGIKKPRLAVCGLNPHAGDEGYIGREEIKIIGPAVKRAQRKIKSTITGPLSPDVIFYQAYSGKYDAVICMYHDQGQIPLKMISRGHGVNVTLGLPFVRTSPDHGTGYDIAGKFIADPSSMKEALALAVTLCRNRRRHAKSSL
jgi:4-hydroxythreonine-4-phosphate dehydrogenase